MGTRPSCPEPVAAYHIMAEVYDGGRQMTQCRQKHSEVLDPNTPSRAHSSWPEFFLLGSISHKF